ncbi:MAG TPA: hypothetical protein VFR06_03525 [Gallionellaceae bacterium]|nr:hypothetical protein [Gallionellaceae bacterium]
MNYKLPSLKIVTAAVFFTWAYRAQFLKAIAFPTLALVVVWAVWVSFSDKLPSAFSWLTLLIYGLSFSFLAVTCHRLILVGDDDRHKPFRAKPGYRELRFLAWLIAIYVLKILLELVAWALVGKISGGAFSEGGVGNAYWLRQASSIPALYVLARLSLAFPATAVDKPVSLSWSWARTHGNGWRIFVVVGLFPWVIGMLFWLVVREEATVLEQVVLSILAYVGLAIEVVALSFTYKELAKHYATNVQPVSGETRPSLAEFTLDAFHDLPRDARSRKFDVGVKVAMGLVTGYLFIGFLLSHVVDCRSELISSSTSPGGSYKAELLNRSCKSNKEQGLVLDIARTSSPNTIYSYPLSRSARRDVDFVWTTDGSLTVRHAVALDRADMPPIVGGIQIVFERRQLGISH